MATPSIPPLGLGTYRNDDHDTCVESVKTALNVGYRHVDTAEAYGNEDAVGEGIRASDVDREDVFLGTKVLHPKFTDSYAKEDILASARACLERLGVDSVELFYGIHWPNGQPPAYDLDEVAAACEEFYDEGGFERFGVCNLTPDLVDDVRAATELTVDALQIEMHPLLPQEEVRAYCEDADIDVVAYGPLGNGEILDDPTLLEVADRHGVSTAQVSLAWLREKGVHPIPKAVGEAHVRDNWRSLDLELDDADVAAIDDIDRTVRVYDPDYAPVW
ncbi:MAG: aldo/keto reductase [Salinigranum sp.]